MSRHLDKFDVVMKNFYAMAATSYGQQKIVQQPNVVTTVVEEKQGTCIPVVEAKSRSSLLILRLAAAVRDSVDNPTPEAIKELREGFTQIRKLLKRVAEFYQDLEQKTNDTLDNCTTDLGRLLGSIQATSSWNRPELRRQLETRTTPHKLLLPVLLLLVLQLLLKVYAVAGIWMQCNYREIFHLGLIHCFN